MPVAAARMICTISFALAVLPSQVVNCYAHHYSIESYQGLHYSVDMWLWCIFTCLLPFGPTATGQFEEEGYHQTITTKCDNSSHVCVATHFGLCHSYGGARSICQLFHCWVLCLGGGDFTKKWIHPLFTAFPAVRTMFWFGCLIMINTSSQ